MIRYFTIFFLQLISFVGYSQCFSLIQSDIPDDEVNQWFLNVEGATNDDLASPSQGICNVRIIFKHPKIGDLKVTLVSPTGQSVTLIGNQGISAVTKNSTWDVQFVPCVQPTAPDIGIFPKWANSSNWQSNTNYLGIYHPVTGNCLEDFNTGTVNGLWKLEIDDGSPLDIGFLELFQVEFCDPSGINCSSCYKKAGMIEEQTITSCEGNQALNPTIIPTIPGGGNEPSTQYKFIVGDQNDKLIAILDNVNLTNFAPGSYTVCGFAYDATHSNLLPLTDGSIKFSEFKNSYLYGNPILCGDITLSCLTFHILPKSPVQNIVDYVCLNFPILIENQLITIPGMHFFNYKNRFGCDSTINYSIIDFNPILNLIVDGVLTCAKKTLIISANLITIPNTAQISWFTLDGKIDQIIDVDSVLVSLPGTYYLAINYNGCTDTFSTQVNIDNTLPNLSVSTLVLNCSNPTGQIFANSTTANVTFEWSGPNNFASTLQNPNITEIGTYTVKAIKDNGCFLERTTIVTADYNVPILKLNKPVKNCENDQVVFSIQNPKNDVIYTWQLPDGSILKANTITTNLDGWIYVNALGTNGCFTKDSFFVTYLSGLPEFFIRDTFINCSNSSTFLPFETNDVGLTIQWAGPNNFTSNLQNPQISVGGTYTVTVKNNAGCIIIKSLIVTEDFNAPTISLNVGTIGCKTDSIQIFTTSNPTNLVYKWTGVNAFHSNKKNPFVEETGWFYVTAVAQNGCIVVDSIEVKDISTNPEVNTVNDSLTCFEFLAQLNAIVTSPNVFTISWTGPDPNINTPNILNPTVKVPGKYWLKITNPTSGCFTKKSALIYDFSSPPNVTIIHDSITCIQDSAIISILPTNQIVLHYWELADGTKINDSLSITVHEENQTIKFIALNSFGCKLDTSITTMRDDTLPEIVFPNLVLNCNYPSTNLSLTSDFTIENYLWTFPDGSQHIEPNPLANLSGDYIVQVSSQNGCESIDTFYLGEDFSTPIIDAIGGSFTCQDGHFNLNFTSNHDQFKEILWTGPNGFSSNTQSLQVNASGMYYLKATSLNGCTSFDSAFVELIDVLPSLTVENDTINCKNNSFLKIPVSNAIAPEFTWTLPNGNQVIAPSIEANVPGIYIVQVKDQKSCTALDTFSITIDTLRLNSNVNKTYTLTCTNDSLLLVIPTLVNSNQ